jgi:hypothetical protein
MIAPTELGNMTRCMIDANKAIFFSSPSPLTASLFITIRAFRCDGSLYRFGLFHSRFNRSAFIPCAFVASTLYHIDRKNRMYN